MRDVLTYRILLAIAMLAPFGFWVWDTRIDWALDWRWGLVVPVVLGGYAGVEAWQRRLPQRQQIALLALLVVGVWAFVLAVNRSGGESRRPVPEATREAIVRAILAGSPPPDGWEVVTPP